MEPPKLQGVAVAIQRRLFDPQADACKDLAVILEGSAELSLKGLFGGRHEQQKRENARIWHDLWRFSLRV